MIFRECERCGVAFDVGFDYCRETGCSNNGTEAIAPVVKKSLQRLRQKQVLKAPQHIARFNTIRYRANKKGIEFTLTPEFVRSIMETPCIYCGCGDGYSELDRKDSSIGYVKHNMAPACRRCNTIKNNVVSYDEMMFIANYLGWRDNARNT